MTKGSKKGKKPLPTTLGKAPGPSEKEVDLSHVRRPIDTSVVGLRQVVSLLSTATDEVKNYITYECDIIYECKVCKTIFRSLANFILHKRSFCKQNYSPIAESSTYCNESSEPPHPPQSITNIELSHLQPQLLDSDIPFKGLSGVVAKLKEKQEINHLTQEILNKDFSKENQEVETARATNDMLLEKIATNNAAVFQTLLKDMPESNVKKPESIQSEVMEIHGMLENDGAVLGADGKICKFQTNKANNNNPNIPKPQIACTECNMQFSTKATLSLHLKNKHNDTSSIYVCPDCKKIFANPWSVYRHLYKVHRRTSAQVKKLREQVHISMVRKDYKPNKKHHEKESEKLDKTDEENQWLNNIEGDKAFQMCGGCGKRFERRAALHSHATMCIKRIAVCNTIKENNAKKKEEESKDMKTKVIKVDKMVTDLAPAKGASKRKPYLLRTYKTIGQIEKVPDVNDNKIICDNTELTSDSQHPRKVEENNRSASEVINPLTLSTIKNFMENDKNLLMKSHHNSEHFIHEKSCNVSDFDLLCKRVLEHLRQKGVSEELEKPADCMSKDSNQDNKSDTATRNNDIFEETVTHVDTNYELEMNTSLDIKSTSPGRISIHSLDDLIGFSKEEQEQVTKIPIPTISSPTRTLSNPGSTRVLRSPRSPNKAVRRSTKRKRTKSLDYKNLKMSNLEEISDYDPAFMTKAAPYMDDIKLTCKSCHTKYTTLSDLICHMSAHFSWFRYQCSRCPFISYCQADCVKHAERLHRTEKSEIESVVLPIPNWKTVLMSNKFRELSKSEETSWTQTEQVTTGCKGGEETVGGTERDLHDNIMDTLFADSSAETASEYILFPTPISGEASFIKTESIDIVDEDKDCFQMEMPEEIYSMDISDLDVNQIDDWENERYNGKNESKIEEKLTIKSELCDNDSVVPELVNVGKQPIAKVDIVSIKTEEPVVNTRPTRNRMRSIKTLQNDFFYELRGGKTVVTKTDGMPKLKLQGPNPYSKSEKKHKSRF